MKGLRLFLLVALITGGMVCGVCAAPNPLGDVPAGHWAYKDLNALVKAGLIDGYNGKFNDGKTLTRYEMAQLVAKAMAKVDKADAQTKAAVERLAKELDAELENNFLIRLDELEKKADNFRMVGSYIRVKYDVNKMTLNGQEIKSSHPSSWIRAHLGFQGDVNEDWKWTVHLRQQSNWYTSGAMGSQSSFVNRAYVSGKVGDVDVALGKISYTCMDMTLFDSYYNGIKLGFGKDLKTTLYHGYHSGNAVALPYDTTNKSKGAYIQSMATGISTSKALFTGAELNYKFSPYTELSGVYFIFDGVDLPASKSGYNIAKKDKVWELWLVQKLSDDWKFEGTYIRSDAKEDNTGYTAMLQYKDVNRNKPGSWKIALQYRNAQRFAQWNGGGYNFDILVNPLTDNKGSHNTGIWELGFQFSPFKNAIWRNWICRYSATDGSGLKESRIVSYIQYWF
jgi:hypothetical protein